MCGRYTITVTFEELLAYFALEEPAMPPFHKPRYNVAPGQLIPAVINDGEQLRIGQLKWGLIPSWAKDAKLAYKMINARAETVHERPAYKGPFRRKRCLIPADGFYEWKAAQDGSKRKQPMRIALRSRSIFNFAGLYDIWISPEGEKISTCTIITTEPNALVKPIHDRMPVILPKEDEQKWLEPDQHPEVLHAMLKPYDVGDMYTYPVSAEVGNVKNDREELIKEI